MGKLNNLGSENRVALCWVAGHTGVSGNDKSNLLAKKAPTISSVRPAPFCGIGTSTYKRKLMDTQKKLSDTVQFLLPFPWQFHKAITKNHARTNQKQATWTCGVLRMALPPWTVLRGGR